jgi:hypothetical protein
MSLPMMTIEGEVIGVHSHWAGDHSRIVTEATVQTADGQRLVVSQLGGTVDGIGMITMPGVAPLEPGMRVAVAVHHDVDLQRRTHVVLDSMKVLAYPPGYVRKGLTQAGHSLFWESSCAFVTVDAAGTAAIPGDEEFAVIDVSIATWNSSTATCSYLDLVSDGIKSLEVGKDGVNLIKFRDTTWGRPAVDDDPPRMHPPSFAGVTSIFFVNDGSARDGAVLDADIELNGVNFAISVNGTSNSNQPCRAELQNNLTHELGHLLGLEHTCLAFGDPPRRDNLGNEVPECAETSYPKIIDSTMYNFQNCGEITKQTLTNDDIQGMCDTYPLANDRGACDRVGGFDAGEGGGTGDRDGPPDGKGPGGCCSAAGGHPGASLLFAATTMFLVTRPRRRVKH